MGFVSSPRLRDAWLAGLSMSVLAIACGPPAKVLRGLEDAEVIGGSSGEGGEGGEGGGGGSSRPDTGLGGIGGGSGSGGGGSGGMGGSAGRDASPDLPRDLAAAPDLPPDVAPDLTPDLTAAPDVGGAGKVVLLVVGFGPPKEASLRPGDIKIRQRLEQRGFTVRIGDDDDPDASKANGAHLIIITETNGPQIGTKYTNLTVPLICSEPTLFDDLRMSAAMGAGANTATIEITQLGMASLLAGGKMGVVTVAGSALSAIYANPPSTAERIALMPGQLASQATIFGYASGAMMTNMPAPAKRVGLFVSEAMANGMNDNGWQLYDAAIDWALQ